MIHGIGTDIVHIPRIVRMSDKYGDKFHKKFLHPSELNYLNTIKLESHRNSYLASRFVHSIFYFILLLRLLRWSTKEAAYKAFGKWRIPFYDMKVSHSKHGIPELTFDGLAKEVAEANNIGKAHVSISHDHDYAVSYVILEKELKNVNDI